MANAVTMAPKTAPRKALASVKRGVLQMPVRALIYGAEKVGKSTFAAGAPAPIFVGADDGTVNLDVSRIEPSSWDEAVAFVREIATEQHEYETLVVDPINWLEPLCWARVCSDAGASSIEEVGGGWGKGYTAAVDRWREFVLELERCWKRGMHVLITAHALVRPFANPEGPAYDRYELSMNPKAAGVVRQWVDAVLFARLETMVKVEKGRTKGKGYSTGMRILHTQPCAAYDAGSRWKLPEELPLSWDDFWEAVQAERGRADELVGQLRAMAEQLGDPKVTEQVAAFIEKNKGNADRLAEAANRLTVRLEDKKKESAA
jgi:hypothetical protein